MSQPGWLEWCTRHGVHKLVVLVWVTAASACTSNVQRPVGDKGPVTEIPVDPVVPIPQVEPVVPVCEATGVTGVQRLTRSEYDRTVADLLGTTSRPGQRFPDDNRANVFDNNAQVNGVTALTAAAYFEAAEVLATEVVTQRPLSVISCEPSAELTADACASQILGRLVRRAYRRPVEAAELEAVLAVYRAAQAQGHDVALQNAIHAVLVAPQFLFRGTAATLGAAHALDEHALATRLSYLLWGSMPDDALSLNAEQGQLAKPEVLQAEIKRMLADARASALVDSFAGQWLSLRLLDVAEPDAALFPEFTAGLKSDMLAESQAFLHAIFADGAPMRDLLTAPYTFVNANMAAYYGLPAPSSAGFARVDLSGSERRGILTQASLLTVTSNPDRTSVVRRGKWILDSLLCQPLPPPPNGVSVTLPDAQASANKFEQLAQHRSSPICNGCHSIVDPLGFALEAYDPIGRVRSVDETGRPLYTIGTLPDGTVVNGARELVEHLATTGQFESCMATNLLTYALGRELGAGDSCVVQNSVSRLDFGSATFSALVAELASSPAFNSEGAAP